MYRILLKKTGMPKDHWTYYSTVETTPVLDPTTGEAKSEKETIIFETADMSTLEDQYKKLLMLYTVDQLMPVDILKVTLDATIEDVTG